MIGVPQHIGLSIHVWGQRDEALDAPGADKKKFGEGGTRMVLVNSVCVGEGGGEKDVWRRPSGGVPREYHQLVALESHNPTL